MDDIPRAVDIAIAPPLARPWWKKALASPGVWLIAAVLVFAWLFYEWVESIGGPGVLRTRYGLWAMLVLVPVQALVAVSPFPSEVLVVANSLVYGFWVGSAMAWVGWMLAAYLQYFLARRTAHDLDIDVVRARLPRWLSRFPVHHPMFLIFGRWLPWGPHLVNTAAGVFGVSLWRHGWCAGLATIPHALFVCGLTHGLDGYWRT
jgi:uncharacterized membrane protein YdjX (TVP38/TMEM64 family)